ncbi:hypothetical protein AB0B50_03575 [Streptomyces sp. NPDC041068]|uniref:hypothetical protein n=1 Tax=Streptomyces sp. NPDC041068 TaxID=3155130 RepID=UPI0033FA5D55
MGRPLHGPGNRRRPIQTGVARFKALNTAADHLERGDADEVLSAALGRAVDESCGTRFLAASATDRPRHWYARRGFSVIGTMRRFERD